MKKTWGKNRNITVGLEFSIFGYADGNDQYKFEKKCSTLHSTLRSNLNYSGPNFNSGCTQSGLIKTQQTFHFFIQLTIELVHNLSQNDIVQF